MKKLSIFYSFAIFCIAMGCNKNVNDDIVNIDMQSMMDEDNVTFIDDIFDDVSFIKFECNDSILLSNDAFLKLIDDYNIYIESENRLLRFNPEGKFLNYIGNRGKGPEEYPYVGNVFKKNGGNIILSNSKKIMEFTPDGEFVGMQKEPDNYISLVIDENMKIKAIERNYGKSGTIEEYLTTIQKNGEIINKQKLYGDSVETKIVWTGVPERYIIHNNEYFRDEWSCTIKEISDNSDVKDSFTFDFGDKNPVRMHYQDASARRKLGESVVELSTWITNGHYSIISVFYQNSMYLIITDQTSGKCLFSRKYDAQTEFTGQPGIALKDMPSVTVWPDYVDKRGNLYGLIDPASLTEEDILKFNNSTGMKISDEDNYILIKLGSTGI